MVRPERPPGPGPLQVIIQAIEPLQVIIQVRLKITNSDVEATTPRVCGNHSIGPAHSTFLAHSCVFTECSRRAEERRPGLKHRAGASSSSGAPPPPPASAPCAYNLIELGVLAPPIVTHHHSRLGGGTVPGGIAWRTSPIEPAPHARSTHADHDPSVRPSVECRP